MSTSGPGTFRWRRWRKGDSNDENDDDDDDKDDEPRCSVRERTRERNDRVLRCFFSVAAADSTRARKGGTGLLECIMHAKWRGFLEITGAAPLPDEGVLR